MPYKDKVKAKEYAKEYRALRKDINRKYQKAYRDANKEALQLYKQTWYQSKRFDKYGITQLEFDLALSTQHNACAICDTNFSDTVRVYVDHCHKTGKVRGLLCFHCNTGLGHFKDDTSILYKALDYLHDHPFCYS